MTIEEMKEYYLECLKYSSQCKSQEQQLYKLNESTIWRCCAEICERLDKMVEKLDEIDSSLDRIDLHQQGLKILED